MMNNAFSESKYSFRLQTGKGSGGENFPFTSTPVNFIWFHKGAAWTPIQHFPHVLLGSVVIWVQ